MQSGKQIAIFCDLLILLKELIAEEQKYVLYAKEHHTIELYHLYFGNEVLCDRIYQGVCRSIEYSGNIYDLEICFHKDEVEQRIMEVNNILNI